MLTWEGEQIQGAAAIVEKLTVRLHISLAHCSSDKLTHLSQSLPFSKVVHQVTKIDAQPSSPSTASLIVSVIGLLKVSAPPDSSYRVTNCFTQVDDGEHPLQFSQVFQLIPDGSSYYVCVCID